jgi:hypothetical protein
MLSITNFKNKFTPFFLIISIYYFFIPIIFLGDNFIKSNNLFKHEVYFLERLLYSQNYIIYNFLTLLFLLLVFLYFYKIFFLSNLKKKIKINYFTYNIIIIVCIFFLLNDLLNLLKYYFDNEIIHRGSLYVELLNNRRTHINLLIIISVINFKNYKKLSYLSYFLIIIYSLLSLSRIDLFLLFFFHLMTNFSFNNKNNKKILLSFFFIIFIIIFYRFILSGQSFILIFIEPLHLMISSKIFFSNLLLFNFNDYIILNFNFFIKDFFYLPVNLKNYFLLNYPEMPTYSIRGADSLICFFIVFIIYSFILRFLINNFYIDKYFLNCVFAYLLISLFRGNFVHNLNFIIKIYLLTIFLTCTFQKIRQLRSKVV